MTHSETKPKGSKRIRLPGPLRAAIRAANNKKAEDIVVLDLRKADGFTDYFLICSGTSTRHVQTIAEGVQRELLKFKVRPSHLEGAKAAEWILMDYFDFVVHILTPKTRAFYGLERLWGSAIRMDIPESGEAERADAP